ncbi:MAG: OmpA family protein [Desulfotalea sp.]
MNKTSYTNIFITTLLGSALILASGCSQKRVIAPPTPKSSTQGEYVIPEIPPAEANNKGYTEDGISEGSLDDTYESKSMDGKSDAQQTREYLIMHGRSSKEMQPVYFSFDQTQISPAMQEVIFKNSRVLKTNPSISVVIEGNTDEQGTNEYNMALGERRALNVGKYLISLGIEKSKIRTVSLGEERPLFTNDTEEDLRHNRRADFIIE